MPRGVRGMQVGALTRPNGRCRFRVWAPGRASVAVRLLGSPERLVPMRPSRCGYWSAEVEGVPPGALYLFRLDGATDLPDPASHDQPEGVHGPSRVVDHDRFEWHDAGWAGLPLERLVFYELHPGAFTPHGTFDAIVPRLDELARLGTTAVEVMPVAAFPGSRNWGYDGTYPYAVQASYGGPDGLKRLVDACHRRGLAAVLDVVYNHLGPEGSYLAEFGPYFTPRYATPWGQAVNYDGEESAHVRSFFVENALHWLGRYHFDALRLDAVHGIYDFSAATFLADLAAAAHRLGARRGRPAWLVAESDLNDPRVVRAPELGGFGLDAQWSDDFHHALHALLTGEAAGWYADFGRVADFARAFEAGYVLAGRYSKYRRRRHGAPPAAGAAPHFVVFAQNHDQVGGRMKGERLASLVPFEALKLAAAATLFAPALPLLFMGEEYGEEAPFLYFVEHSDPALVEAVRKGRREEYRQFAWSGEPPDPQSPETFERSKLRWEERRGGRHAALLDFTRTCLLLRRSIPALAVLDRDAVRTRVVEDGGSRLFSAVRWAGGSRAALFLNFGDREGGCAAPEAEGAWRRVLDSADARWDGPGVAAPEHAAAGDTVRLAPRSAALYERAAGPEAF